MAEDKLNTKENIKNHHQQNFEMALYMLLDDGEVKKLNKGEEGIDEIDVAEFYLKSLKIIQKQKEIYKNHNYYPNRHDINCQIHYSFQENGLAI